MAGLRPSIHALAAMPDCSAQRVLRIPFVKQVALIARRKRLLARQHYLLGIAERRLSADEMKILVVEDDRETASYLVKGLSESGYTVDRAAEGREGLFLATSGGYDAIILDRMLPSLDGPLCSAR